AAVCAEPVQPGAYRGPSLEAAQALPGRQQGFLEDVLGVAGRAEDPVAVHLKLTPVRPDKLTEGVSTPALRRGQEVGSHPVIVPQIPRAGRPLRPPAGV